MGYGYSVADGARTVMGYPYEGLKAWSDFKHEWKARIRYSEAWSDWRDDALSCLSHRWSHVTDGPWRDGHPAGRVIAQSRLHELLLDECQGGYGYAYLSVVPRPDLDPWTYWGYEPTNVGKQNLARATVDAVAKSIFDKLADLREISVPGGYTSSPYRPKVKPAEGSPAPCL